MIRTIPGNVDARNLGFYLAAVFRYKVAILIGWDIVGKGTRIGNMAYGDEHAFAIDLLCFTGLHVFHLDARHISGLVGKNFFNDEVPSHFDLLVTNCSVSHDFRSSQFIASVDKSDFAAEAG